jgi:hypothetical protein
LSCRSWWNRFLAISLFQFQMKLFCLFGTEYLLSLKRYFFNHINSIIVILESNSHWSWSKMFLTKILISTLSCSSMIDFEDSLIFFCELLLITLIELCKNSFFQFWGIVCWAENREICHFSFKEKLICHEISIFLFLWNSEWPLFRAEKFPSLNYQWGSHSCFSAFKRTRKIMDQLATILEYDITHAISNSWSNSSEWTLLIYVMMMMPYWSCNCPILHPEPKKIS